MSDIAPFIGKLFDETLTLMADVRDYVSRNRARDMADADPVARLATSCELMRITARLTEVTTWVMMQRAIANGEIGQNEASAFGSFTDSQICLDTSTASNPELPPKVRSFLEKSFAMYERTSRLDALRQKGANEV